MNSVYAAMSIMFVSHIRPNQEGVLALKIWNSILKANSCNITVISHYG